MEPAHPIPKRKPSVAALEKLASNAEEMMANAVATGDNSSKDARSLPKVPPFNATSTTALLLESTIPALSRTPSQSPPILTQIPPPQFSHSTPHDWPFVLPDGTQLDASTAEALCALSDATWLDEPLFSPTSPSAGEFAFDWSSSSSSSCNQNLGGSPLMLTAPAASLDYCNIAPPNQLLRSTSLSNNSPNDSSPFGMLFPGVPVMPMKPARIKHANNFSEIASLSNSVKSSVGLAGDSDVAAGSGDANVCMPENSILPADSQIGFHSLSYVPQQFSSIDQVMNWDGSTMAAAASPSSSSTLSVTGQTPRYSNSVLEVGQALSLHGDDDDQVEEYVEVTFRNCSEEVKRSWSNFLKKMIAEDSNSRSFWLSEENAAVWASLSQPGNCGGMAAAGDLSGVVGFADLDNGMMAEQLLPLQWPMDMGSFGNLNLNLETTGDEGTGVGASGMEFFGMDLNDAILLGPIEAGLN